MIVFNLLCNSCNYNFEGWFDNSNEYNNQKKKNQKTEQSSNGVSY